MNRLGVLLAAFVLLLGLAAACESDGNGGSGGQDAAGGGQDTGGGGGEPNRVTVSLVDLAIEMPETLPAGPTTFVVTNNGEMPHNFEIEGNGIDEVLDTDLAPGATDELTVELEAGTYEVYCPIAGHRAAGMELDLTVN